MDAALYHTDYKTPHGDVCEKLIFVSLTNVLLTIMIISPSL